MDWVIENWIWIALAILLVWLYTKMRGGHEHSGHEHGSQGSGHGKHDDCCGHCDENQSENRPVSGVYR